MKKIKSNIHGWIVLDKSTGRTSTQALGRARRLVEGGKVGHGGTLDPLATGILPLAFGEATKLIPYIMDGDKEYQFTVRWGEQRDTDDAEGKVIATNTKRPSDDEIRGILSGFVGEISQTPPAFSAIKLEGQRAYDIARSGGTPELVARKITVHSFELTGRLDGDRSTFRVHCGKGVYVRALARDMAMKLGTCGYIAALRRTRVGPFTLEQAVTMEQLEALSKRGEAGTAVLGLRAGLGDVQALECTAAEAQKLRAGQGVLVRPQHGDMAESSVIFAEHQGVPVAVAEVKAGEFRVVRGFHF